MPKNTASLRSSTATPMQGATARARAGERRSMATAAASTAPAAAAVARVWAMRR